MRQEPEDPRGMALEALVETWSYVRGQRHGSGRKEVRRGSR